MGQTLTEKILSAHLVEGEMVKGSEIGIRIDQTLTQDATGTMAYLEFEAMGVPRVKTERSVAYITIIHCRMVLKMLMTIDLSAVSVKNTEFTSQDPVTVFVTKYILSVSVFRVKHLSVRTAIHRQAAV